MGGEPRGLPPITPAHRKKKGDPLGKTTTAPSSAGVRSATAAPLRVKARCAALRSLRSRPARAVA